PALAERTRTRPSMAPPSSRYDDQKTNRQMALALYAIRARGRSIDATAGSELPAYNNPGTMKPPRINTFRVLSCPGPSFILHTEIGECSPLLRLLLSRYGHRVDAIRSFTFATGRAPRS